jgi:N-acetylglutamate synthase-like GNAT family acetyltransferase
MKLSHRPYYHPTDYALVSQFLIRHYQPNNQDGNWIEPAWEYSHHHSFMDSANLDQFGIWEENGEIVGVAHYESHMGEAFFQFHPAYRHLRQEMLDYAETHLLGQRESDGQKYLMAYVNDNDAEFLALVRSRGYQKAPHETRPMAKFAIPRPFPAIELPTGYRLQSLADDPDWAKVHSVLWRGFDHGEVPPISEEDKEDRRKMFDTPKARRDLKIVTIAPNGEFASFCGMFYEATGKFGYVEPVATDPAHRRLGLGKAAVLEGIRRCAELGATVAYVGSDQPFYLAMGFEVIYNTECWVKTF